MQRCLIIVIDGMISSIQGIQMNGQAIKGAAVVEEVPEQEGDLVAGNGQENGLRAGQRSSTHIQRDPMGEIEQSTRVVTCSGTTKTDLILAGETEKLL